MKYAWLVICVSLVASKAAAAIPDSSGVFHGCYNVFTGSMRVIDGTNCGLFERHVAWQQTGIQGPQGPVGPQGPAGPSNADKMIVDSEDFQFPNLPAQPEVEARTFATKSFTATGTGSCTVGYTAFLSDDSLPRVELYPSFSRDEETIETHYTERAMFGGNGDGAQQGSTVYGFRIHPGITYRVGFTIVSYDALSPNAFGNAFVTWVCKYD